MQPVSNVSTNLGDMRDLVWFLTNEDEDVFPASTVDRAINEGLKKVHQITDHSPVIAQFTTDPGDNSYSIPEAKTENNRAMVDRVYVNGVRIFPSMPSVESEEGEPTSFSVVGKNLLLFPVPDDLYEVYVEYRKEFTPLTEDDQYPDLSDEMINAAIKYACYLLKIKDEEFESANMFKAEWDEARASVLTLTTGLYQEGTLFGGGR